MIAAFYKKVAVLFSKFQSFSLLAVRLVLAYGFFEPAMHKIKDIHSFASFLDSLGIPLPLLQAYMVMATEALGVVLPVLGLFVRLISLPLMVVMLVAVFLVHLPGGFSAANNGFEIPLYYLLFLMVLAVFGAGKFSLDYLLFERKA